MSIQAHLHDPARSSWFATPAKDDMKAFASVTIATSCDSQTIVFSQSPEVLREIAASFEHAANQLEEVMDHE